MVCLRGRFINIIIIIITTTTAAAFIDMRTNTARVNYRCLEQGEKIVDETWLAEPGHEMREREMEGQRKRPREGQERGARERGPKEGGEREHKTKPSPKK